MRNRMYGGVRGRKTRVGEKLHRFPPTRLLIGIVSDKISAILSVYLHVSQKITTFVCEYKTCL